MRTLCLLGLALALLTIFLVANNPKKITLAKRNYQRVVSLAPSFSETMIALKQGHLLVGVTSQCLDKSLNGVEKIGSFAEANFEAILALKPDLVLAVPHALAKNVVKLLRENHIEVYAHQPDSLADIKQIISGLAQIFHVNNLGLELNQKIDQALDKAQTFLRSNNHSAIIAFSYSPLVIAGTGSFPGEIISKMGLLNMAQSSLSPWPVWPLEKLISDPPELFIVATGREHWTGFKQLFASLGLTPEKSNMHFIIPDHPIFNSPSPVLIKDIDYLLESISAK